MYDVSRGAARQVYPATTPQLRQDVSAEDTVLAGHRQWLVKHALLPEWPGQLVKQVLHAPTSAEVRPVRCAWAVRFTT